MPRRLIAQARLVVLVGVAAEFLAILAILPALAATLTATRLATALLGLLRLVHGVQNAKIMFRVLKIALRHHPVAGAGGIAPKLQIFLEELLGSAANPQIRATAVEHVVAVERNIAAMMANRAAPTTASAAAATPAATITVVASAHAFHIH